MTIVNLPKRYMLKCANCGAQFFEVEEGEVLGYVFGCCDNPQIVMEEVK